LRQPGATVDFAGDAAYAKTKETLKQHLMANLTRRGLTPLREDRTIDNVRALESKQAGRKGKAKVKDDIDE
jgi:hypothetical protein